MAHWIKRLALALTAGAGAAALSLEAANSALASCQDIGREISSSSSVVYATSANFTTDIHHNFLSSTQVPACVLEAGSPADISKALRIIAKNKTPFNVKSGGHASNPGFSSTTGVLVVFKGDLSQVTVSADRTTVEIGMGQTWSQVYDILQNTGLNVVGGRTTGPGVGGFSLGGGYSWKTSQYGLTCDNIEAFNIVLPNASLARAEAGSELFFALKGGLNRFGIVTTIEYAAHAQAPLVYGGLAVYGPEATQQVLNATQAFYDINTDPKAQIITSVNVLPQGNTPLTLFFYDGPARPASFAPFDGLVPVLNEVQTQSFSSFVSSIPSQGTPNVRGIFNTVSTSKLTPRFLAAVYTESQHYGALMELHGGQSVEYDVEPFLAYGQHATDSAYPHADSPLPLDIFFSWIGTENDEFWDTAARASASRLKQVAISEGIYSSDDTAYPNYAIFGTPAQDLYGAVNARRLAVIRQQVDPEGVMELAGGFAV